jgi:hypothetical protein
MNFHTPKDHLEHKCDTYSRMPPVHIIILRIMRGRLGKVRASEVLFPSSSAFIYLVGDRTSYARLYRRKAEAYAYKSSQTDSDLRAPLSLLERPWCPRRRRIAARASRTDGRWSHLRWRLSWAARLGEVRPSRPSFSRSTLTLWAHIGLQFGVMIGFMRQLLLPATERAVFFDLVATGMLNRRMAMFCGSVAVSGRLLLAIARGPQDVFAAGKRIHGSRREVRCARPAILLHTHARVPPARCARSRSRFWAVRSAHSSLGSAHPFLAARSCDPSSPFVPAIRSWCPAARACVFGAPWGVRASASARAWRCAGRDGRTGACGRCGRGKPTRCMRAYLRLPSSRYCHGSVTKIHL